jgi:hypothetical protein
MAITKELDTLIGQVRFHLGDKTEGSGVLPGGGNLTDEEIDFLLGQQGSDVMRAVTAAADIIRRAWAQASATAAGPLKSNFEQIYDHWAAESERLGLLYGSATATTAFSHGAARSDAYSDDGTTPEYGPRRRLRLC